MSDKPKSRYRDAFWSDRSPTKPWLAVVTIQGKSHYGGFFATDREAAEASLKLRQRIYAQQFA